MGAPSLGGATSPHILRSEKLETRQMADLLVFVVHNEKAETYASLIPSTRLFRTAFDADEFPRPLLSVSNTVCPETTLTRLEAGF